MAGSPIQETIKQIADEYGMDWKLLYSVCKVESNCEPGKVGDSGGSIGWFQISLVHHPDVTEEQANDLKWSAEWTVKHCEKYKDDLKMFSLCHNGIGKYPRNQWYVDRVVDEYNTLVSSS